jgi:hypothetical protein
LKNLSGPELSPCEPTKQGKEALFWGCTPIKKYAPDAIITIFQTVSEEFFSETRSTVGSNLPHKITELPVGLAF